MPSKKTRVRPKITKSNKSKIRTSGKNRFRWKYGKKIRVPEESDIAGRIRGKWIKNLAKRL